MSDAYGTITFNKSEDCTFDGALLVQELNSFNWSNDGAKWLVNEPDEYLYLDTKNPQYPVAIPEFDEFIHVRNNDGTWTTYNSSKFDDDIFENMFSTTSAPYSLNELSLRLSPHIKNGWVEIACCANEKARYVYFQSLRICSNGTAMKRNFWSGPCIDPIDENESYEPEFELAI